MLKTKIRNHFTPFGLFIKNNWILILITEALVLASTIFGYSFLPFFRGIDKNIGITFVVLFTLTAIASLATNVHLFTKKKNINTDPNNTVRFYYFFSTLFVNGLILTIILIIVRAVNPNSQYLIQGFASILLLLIYFLIFGLTTYSGIIIKRK